MFIIDLLPMYYNIHIDNVNLDRYEGNIGIKYNFETFEGSAQIICKYLLEDECIEVLDWNDILEVS